MKIHRAVFKTVFASVVALAPALAPIAAHAADSYPSRSIRFIIPAAAGGTPVGSSPEEFRKFLLHDMAKWADVVKKIGAKVD